MAGRTLEWEMCRSAGPTLVSIKRPAKQRKVERVEFLTTATELSTVLFDNPAQQDYSGLSDPCVGSDLAENDQRSTYLRLNSESSVNDHAATHQGGK
jgi:hypothetical protein